MYDLPYHKEPDEQAVRRFIREHPFACLVGCDADGRPVATQVPVLFEEIEGRNVLSGHFMKNTDHHKAFLDNDQALVIFSGSQAYVSGTWYDDPNSVSTWNYMSVHARGLIRFLDDAGLEEVLRKTSLHFEGDDENSPTAFDNLPAEFTRKAIKLIVAFEIEVTQLDTVFKLSQDRDRASYFNIIEKLKEQGEHERAIAAEMEKRAEKT